MSLEAQITARLAALPHEHLKVENESHRHTRGSETHYKVLYVSGIFLGRSRLERSRWLHETLKAEMQQIHSLTSRLLTPEEWATTAESIQFESPRCQSGRSQS
jgi:BolA protein